MSHSKTELGNQIILVDDDEMQHFLLQKYSKLRGIEHPVICFSNGEEFLAYMAEQVKLQQNPPAVVLLDIRMPRLTGFETLARLRQMPQFKVSPTVLIYSSSDAPSDIEKAKSLGANGFQTKPSNKKDFDIFFTQLLNSIAATSPTDSPSQ